MKIGNKIVLVIFGIFIPLIVTACLAAMTWLHSDVDAIRSYIIEKELESIQSQLNKDFDSFQQVFRNNPLYSSQDLLSLSGNNGGLLRGTQLLGLAGKQLTYLRAQGNDKFVPPPELLASQRERTGVYLDSQRQSYLISLQGPSYAERLLLVRRLTDEYLLNLSADGMITKAEIQIGTATPEPVLVDDIVTAQLKLPSMIEHAPIHLSISFSNHFFSQIALQYTLLTLGLLALIVALQLVLYFWLRHTLIKPFKKLVTQCSKLDVSSKTGQLIDSAEGAELEPLTTNINALLSNLYRQQSHSQVVLGKISEVVIFTDINAKVSYINPYAERMLALNSEQAQGLSLEQVLSGNPGLSVKALAFIQDTDKEDATLLLRLNRDTPMFVNGSLTHLRCHSGRVIGAALVLRDITQQVLLKQQLQRGADFDPITGLVTRSVFGHRLVSYAQQAKSLAVIYLDLEQFKLINDSCGHNAGDEMLSKVAKAIESCLLNNELLGRLGGDEFALAVKDRTALEIAKLSKSIIASVNAQMLLHGDTAYRVGLSIGIALAGNKTQEGVLGLLKDAEIACHSAKQKGSNQIQFFDGRDKDLSLLRNSPKWAVRIVQAIEHNELILYYQKIKRLSSHSHRQRLEILLRIQESDGRLLPPAQLIAAAERFKLIVEVDKEVIRKAFLWLSLNEQLWHDHCLSINLSGNSLGAEGIADFILRQQARFGVPSACICFEITETSAIQNRSRAMKMLLGLRRRGFAFALDDFGSGFASYGYLKEMPVDYVKIDGCFVKNLVSNAKDYAIVKSVNDVCRVMGIETVAEFVENQEIMDKLEIIGVNYAQGYAIGRPQPLSSYQPETVSEILTA
ncbi:EAL domain-containing protein [Shewanella schlegeliana]|uniref:EAL domain-containing protein n=1 Tax=Shewanella schlegeliana TaxID=190308 RepID=A0ABS1T2B5_9GAMM|nr:EAL domain-containing protein [Shewanella schlegeliana]MBL4914814.1 EAL domain-containing protein [Shewanella schlegeliana]MCL1110495.1 EAL domain-containing protein [Shewanella schlegeliana]GIU27410.1 cyclic di-GMP phosphodiesterase PdeB [Shewanella schlegeliana]